MKKLLIGSIILSGVLLVTLVLLKMTGILSWSINATPSNEPALKTGELFFSTNAKAPQRGNFILYTDNYIDSTLMQGGLQAGYNYVKRLCAVPGDVIEMKNGVLFVNQKNFDEDVLLMSFYTAVAADQKNCNYNFDSLSQLPGNNYFIKDSTVMMNLDDKEAAAIKRQIKIERYLQKDTAEVFKWLGYNKGFTADNFGPITVPADCYFVLGDNRPNSLDSRYTGFVAKKDIKGVVLNK